MTDLLTPARGRALPVHQRRLAGRTMLTLGNPGGAVFVLVVVLLVAMIIANPNFGDPGVVIRFLGRTAPIAIAAIGQYYVIVSGEFDLSVGAVIGAQVVIAGNLIGEDASKIGPVLVLMVAVGIGIGLINGLVTTLLRVPSFIVTLGMMLALGGLVDYLTGGSATGNPADEFREIGRGTIDNVPVVDVIPYPLIALTVIAAASAWLMRRPFGRSLLATGDNPASARYSGTATWWVTTRAFVLSSLCATISAVLLVGYAGVHPSVGQGYEFTAITAVVLGGVVLGGGRGWVLSAAAGAFALELLFLLLNVLGVDSTWRPSVQGLIIIAAVALAGRAWHLGRRPPRGPSSASPSGSAHLSTGSTQSPDPGTTPTGDK